MGVFRRRVLDVMLEPTPIPVPRLTIDGWTFDGTADRARLTGLPPGDLRELTTLLHGVAVEVDTPYTYERAAVLLERAGEQGAALSVCEAWLRHPAATRGEHVQHTRVVDRHRARLRGRLSSAIAAAAAP